MNKKTVNATLNMRSEWDSELFDYKNVYISFMIVNIFADSYPALLVSKIPRSGFRLITRKQTGCYI